MDVVERLSVQQVRTGGLLASVHLHRYQLAASLLAGLRVADVCCGVGYGAAILGAVGCDVTAVDVDADAIAQARASFGSDARFEVADAVDFLATVSADRYDGVVLLEGLEHLERSNEALAHLRRLAGQGVRLVVSVPNDPVSPARNPFHLSEFDHAKAARLCDSLPGAFALYQHLAEGSLIGPASPADPEVRLILPQRAEPEYAHTFLLCANVPVEQASVRAELVVAPHHQRYISGLELANAELAAANRRLGRERLGLADSAAASVLAKLAAANEEIGRLKRELDPDLLPDETPEEKQERERRAWVEGLIAEIHRHKEIVADLEASLAEARGAQEGRAFALARRYVRLRARLRGR